MPPYRLLVLLLGALVIVPRGAPASRPEDEVPSPPCRESMSVTVHYPNLFPNGSVWDPVGRSMYPPGTHWVVRYGGSEASRRACPCMLDRPCIRKCCPVGESLDGEGGCAPSESHLFSPNVTEDDGSGARTVDADGVFGVLYGVGCEGAVMVDPDDHFFLRASDASLAFPRRNVTASEFCLDYAAPRGGYVPMLCDGGRRGGGGWGALPPWLACVLSLAVLFSVSFLLVTFLAFAMTPDLRGGLHGRCVLCLVTCLILGCVFLAMVQLAGDALQVNNCVASAYVIQFCFHAAFFWLNVMCFDSCWAFRCLKPNPSLVARREERRFIRYATYAWGAPLAIVSIAVAMDFFPDLPAHLIRPGFGRAKRCWFFTRGAALVYFYVPMVILLTCNLIILLVTAWKLTMGKKEPAMVSITGTMHQDETHQRNIQRYILYLKLFIIMTINFVMELISWIVGGPDVFWYISDVGYTLQNILFFIILVWKDRVHHVILKRLKFCPASSRVQETALRVI